MTDIDHVDDKIRLGTVIRRRRNQLPGLKDFAWHVQRLVESPFTTPWRAAEVIRQVENFVQGKDCDPTTILLLDAEEHGDKDHRWRTCHIDKDLIVADEPCAVVECDCATPVFEQLKEDSFYDPLHYWMDTHH